MRENFDRACSLTLNLEGNDKYTDDPDDPGGPTKYGIAGNYHPGVDIKGLTMGQAKEIFRKKYWEPAGCDDAPYPMDLCLFDAAVNPQGGGNKELFALCPKTWMEFNFLRILRYDRLSKAKYRTGHINRVIRLTRNIMEMTP